ncbi:MAG: hypothetical protein HQM08_19260 [Candidatus Riflebacteria bacterium]|nr:hypothetical protein [Candidatus Riflebacteria bacterium]
MDSVNGEIDSANNGYYEGNHTNLQQFGNTGHFLTHFKKKADPPKAKAAANGKAWIEEVRLRFAPGQKSGSIFAG